MAEVLTDIAADIRDAYSPITADLLTLYWRRDEAMRESQCGFEGKTTSTTSNVYVVLTTHDLWVPSWASKLSVEMLTWVTGDAELSLVKASISGGEESTELSHQFAAPGTSATFTITILDATRAAHKQLEINGDAGTDTTLHVTVRRMWWHQ